MAKLIDLNGLAHVYSIIKGMLADKLGKNDTAAAAIKDDAGNTISTTYASKADVSALLSTKLGVTATAYAATRDGAGNNIVNTYAKKTDIPSAYTLPNATSSTLGGVKIGSNISVSSGTISITKSNVTSALGYTPPTSDTVYDNATATTAGLMSASDKIKLDGIAAGANKYSLPAATSSTLGGVKIGSNISVSSGTISLTKANITAALGYTPVNETSVIDNDTIDGLLA